MSFQTIPGRKFESEVTLMSQGSLIKGEVSFDQMTRIHGRIEGKVHGLAESMLVVGETASVHGEIDCHEIIVDGFVYGNIKARAKVTVSESGRVIGNISAPKVEIRFGAHFEGKATTRPVSV
jgi:cytoskeletal protein CcmA (bactofilin family)